MKEEKKRQASKEKIVTFDITQEMLEDPQMDEWLRESIKKEADEYEKELNSDPALAGIGAPDDLFDSIIGKLKESGDWVEEAEEIKEPEMKAEAPDVYSLLSEEDREALQLGRETREKQIIKGNRRRKRWKAFRYIGVAAAMMVVLFGVSMTSEANRNFVLRAWDGLMTSMGFRVDMDYEGEIENARSVTQEETYAIEKISEILSISPFQLAYLPVGAEYLSYEIIDNNAAQMYYEYQGNIFWAMITKPDVQYSSYYNWDGEMVLKESVLNVQGNECNIWEINLDKKSETYFASVENESCRFMLNGMIPLAEMEKIVKNLFFF